MWIMMPWWRWRKIRFSGFPSWKRPRSPGAGPGSYEISPDNHAILGKIPEVEGLYLANGFSGHGFQHSPAAGKLMAELILGEKPTIDFSILSIERLRKGEYIREAMTAFKD